jgi:hypothetical protein
MAYKLFFTFLLSFTLAFSQNTSGEKLKITFTYTRSYCGGAKPSEEILQQLNTPKILANCRLMLIHEHNMAFKGPVVTTNANGEALVQLTKKGTYSVYLVSNKKNKAELPFNKSCKALLKINLGTFVNAGVDTTCSIRIPCDPCNQQIKARK